MRGGEFGELGGVFILQYITPEMLNELTDEQRERLREWWRPQPGDMIPCEDGIFPLTRIEKLDHGYMCYFVRKGAVGDFNAVEFNFGSRCGILPLLSIGQCIELLLISGKDWYDIKDILIYSCNDMDTELIRALWDAVKAVLNAGT